MDEQISIYKQTFGANRKTTLIALIDDFVSFIWTRRFLDMGEFEIIVPYSQTLFRSLDMQQLVYFSKWPTRPMIIKEIELSFDEEQNRFIAIRGKDLKSIIFSRIEIAPYERVETDQNPLDNLVWYMLYYAFIASTPERNIPDFNVIRISGTPIISSYFIDRGENLGESLTTLIRDYDYGYEVTYDVTTGFAYKTINFRLIKSNIIKGYMIGAEDALERSSYIRSQNEYANTAYIISTVDSGFYTLDRTTIYNGFDRYETYGEVEQKRTAQADTERWNKAVEILKTLDEEVLIDASFSNIDLDKMELGDILEVNDVFGNLLQMRLTEIVVTWDNQEGLKLTPTFVKYEVKEA